MATAKNSTFPILTRTDYLLQVVGEITGTAAMAPRLSRIGNYGVKIML
nr:MAG TPA: hypothetical protein [Caudoviricetes sp.]